MLMDAAVGHFPPVLSTRYCVIGSGMGGSAIAEELVSARQDVLLVEAGGTTRCNEHESMVNVEMVGRSFRIPVSRCIELGGTSNQWHGICGPLDESDFEPRSWIPGSGWPIVLADLIAPYQKAFRKFGVNGSVLNDLNGPVERVKRCLNDLDFDRSSFDAKLVFRRDPPLRWKAPLLVMARKSGFRCLIHAPALELITSDDGGTILELLVGIRGKTIRVKADIFIVCAGALETPRLLLNSNTTLPDGIGNASGMVGRFLMDHPAGHFCKLHFHRPLRAPLYSGMKLDGDLNLMAGLMALPREQKHRRLPNNYVWIRPGISPRRIDDDLLMSFLAVRGVRDLTVRQIGAILANRDLLYRVLVQKFAIPPSFRYGDLFFMTEQVPNARSRVYLSERVRDRHGYKVAAVDWRLSREDLQGFKDYSSFFIEHGLIGSHHSLGRRDAEEVWDQTVSSAAHHLGTTRMADSADHGVVDKNLKVFGTTNLFVCDGSVFATAGAVNPSLTITALAFRLAEHLLSHAAQ